MRVRLMRLPLIGLMLCGASAANAQDDPKFGITMETAPAVGVIWHVSNNFAVKSDIGFSKANTETERSSSDQSGITAGVSARLYMGTWDKLRAYVSPAYLYSRATQHAGSSSLTFENKDSTYSVAGLFGAQYALHKKFAVFGETGVAYSHLTFTSVPSVGVVGTTKSTTTGWRSRSSVGATFYFW